MKEGKAQMIAPLLLIQPKEGSVSWPSYGRNRFIGLKRLNHPGSQVLVGNLDLMVFHHLSILKSSPAYYISRKQDLSTYYPR